MALTFKGNFPKHIRRAAHDVYKAYSTLHQYNIIVERRMINGSTMQAQPVITRNSILNGIDSYRLSIAEYVRDSDEFVVDDLPGEIIKGWFAHEFGHIVDYENRSVLGMAWYGLKYVFSESFARNAEAEADVIAVQHGFYQYVKKTKEFLLSDAISSKYRDKLTRNYMSIEDLEVCNIEWEGRVPG